METEGRLLRSCSIVNAGPESVQRMTDALQSDLAWDDLVEVAKRHRIASRLYHNLVEHGLTDRVPQRHLDDLAQTYQEAAAFHEQLIEGIDRALTALHGAGIQTLVMKGMSLVERVFKDPGLRPMNDVDLLVPEADQPRGRQIVREAMKGWSLPVWKVDVQFHLSDRGTVWDDIPIADIWRDAQAVTIAGHETSLMAPQHELLHLCVHGDHLVRLSWLCDVAQTVIHHGDQFPWDKFIAVARAARVHDLAWFKLRAAQRLLAAPVPSDVLQQLDPGRFKTRIIERLIGQFAFRTEREQSDSLNRPMPVALLEFFSIARFAQRKNLVRMVLAPEVDWMKKQYGPRGLASLAAYYVAHPFLLCIGAGKSLIRRGP